MNQANKSCRLRRCCIQHFWFSSRVRLFAFVFHRDSQLFSLSLPPFLCSRRLPDFIIWFEPPLVAHWIPEKKIWSTEGVYDVKYNEEKQNITFRTTRLGIHGLGAFKFINIPFQSWELKPETGRSAGGGVVLTISAAIVQAEFIVRVFELSDN